MRLRTGSEMKVGDKLAWKRFTTKPDTLVNDSLLEQIRHRSCCEKMRYGSLEKASEIAAHMETWIAKTQEAMHAYYCVFCNEFHVGHSSGESRTQLILSDIEALLLFDFRAPCFYCGNFDRFNGRSKKARI